MTLVCDLLIVMFVLGNPFSHFIYEMGPFQLYAFLYTLIQTIPYMCANMLVKTLSNPYKGHHDMFNTDSVIAWGERTCFANLRSKFVGQAQKKTPKDKCLTPDKKTVLELSTRPFAPMPTILSREGSGELVESASWGALGSLASPVQPASLSPILTPSSPHVTERAGSMLHTLYGNCVVPMAYRVAWLPRVAGLHAVLRSCRVLRGCRVLAITCLVLP